MLLCCDRIGNVLYNIINKKYIGAWKYQFRDEHSISHSFTALRSCLKLEINLVFPSTHALYVYTIMHLCNSKLNRPTQ